MKICGFGLLRATYRELGFTWRQVDPFQMRADESSVAHEVCYTECELLRPVSTQNAIRLKHGIPPRRTFVQSCSTAHGAFLHHCHSTR